MSSPKLDSGGDLPKQEQTRLSKWINPQKAKADPSALENQVATPPEPPIMLNQGLAADVADDRTKARPEDTLQSLGREKKAAKKNKVEPWLPKTPPDVPPKHAQ